METYAISFRLKSIRSKLGLRQREFGERLGISTANVSDLEKGKYQPRFDVLSRIAVMFNVNPDYLLLGKGKMFASETGKKNKDDMGILRDIDNFRNPEAVEELIDYMNKSQLVEYSMLYNFRLLLLKDRDSINKEIKESEKEAKPSSLATDKEK